MKKIYLILILFLQTQSLFCEYVFEKFDSLYIYIDDVLEDKDNNIYIANRFGCILKSTDNGNKWEKIHCDKQVRDLSISEDKYIFFPNGIRTIYQSNDGIKTLNKITLNIDSSENYDVPFNIVFKKDTMVLFLGPAFTFNIKIMKSTDKGATWSYLNYFKDSSYSNSFRCKPVVDKQGRLFFSAEKGIYKLDYLDAVPVKIPGFSCNYCNGYPRFIFGENGTVFFSGVDDQKTHWVQLYRYDPEKNELILDKPDFKFAGDMVYFEGFYYYFSVKNGYNEGVYKIDINFQNEEMIYPMGPFFQLPPRLFITKKGLLLMTDEMENFLKCNLAMGIDDSYDLINDNLNFTSIENFIFYLDKRSDNELFSLELYNILGQCIFKSQGFSTVEEIEKIVRGENIIFYRIINNNQSEYGKILNSGW